MRRIAEEAEGSQRAPPELEEPRLVERLRRSWQINPVHAVAIAPQVPNSPNPLQNDAPDGRPRERSRRQHRQHRGDSTGGASNFRP